MRRLVLTTFCEPCGHNGIEVHAVTSKKVSIGDGPVKEIDLCDSCNRNIMIPLLAAYELCEQEVPAPKQQERMAKKAREVQAGKPRELVAVPTLPEVEETTDDLFVYCTLTEGHKGSERALVRYRDQNTHAEKVHGLKSWKVRWEYPDSRKWYPCTAHKECLQTGNQFKSEISVVRHIASIGTVLTPVDQ